MNKKTLAKLRETLLAQRRNILKQHLNNGSAMPPPGEMATGDAADAASSNDVKEMTLNVKESEKRALQVIEDALTRIEAGNYGLCDECGAQIPEKRLQALPYARYCVTCQENLEKEKV
jgi:DnaK suppressor protein